MVQIVYRETILTNQTNFMKTLTILIIASLLYSCSSSTGPSSQPPSSIGGVWHETGSAWFNRTYADSTWTLDVISDSVRCTFTWRAGVYGDASGSLWAPVVSSDSIYATAGGNNSDYLALGLHGDSLVGTDDGILVSFSR